jgi:hypothetical protein
MGDVTTARASRHAGKQAAAPCQYNDSIVTAVCMIFAVLLLAASAAAGVTVYPKAFDVCLFMQ